MATARRDSPDPFRIIVGVLATRGDSDLLAWVATVAGLRVDLAVSEREDHGHRVRIRILVPRILAAYDELDEQAKLAAANVAFRNFGPAYPDTRARAVEALELAGWRIEGDALVVGSAELGEKFFSKGSPWDAYVAIRNVLQEAKYSLIVLDPYADGTIFQMLAPPAPGLRISILCAKYAPPAALATEAKKFMTQYPGVAIEVRESNDFHDRFIVVDDRSCVHVGASIKDAGKKAFMASRVEDPANVKALLDSFKSAWTSATPVL